MKKIVLLLILIGLGYWAWTGRHHLTQTAENGALTAEVLARIARSKPVSLLSIKVSSNDGIVTLAGKVPSAKDEAQILNDVKNIRKVKEVKDLLSVDEATRTEEDIKEDFKLTALIKKSLIADEGLPVAKIDVDVKKKVVTLSGGVPTKEHADLAVKLTKQIKEVKEVKNNLQVVNR